MKKIQFHLTTIVFLLLSLGSAPAQDAPDAATLTKLLQDFLVGAGKNDLATHERFWADDLIYTGSVGRRVGKADILRDVREDVPPKPGAEVTTYHAEDIRIQQYGDAAVVAFRLVATTEAKGQTTVSKYFNTGTFLKRNGQWQAVAWQATAIPKKEEPKPSAPVGKTDSSG
jgi:hypothetical protein